jgi:hypothetical protein
MASSPNSARMAESASFISLARNVRSCMAV